MRKSKSFSLKRFSLSSLRKSSKTENPVLIPESPFPAFSKLDLADGPNIFDGDAESNHHILTKRANGDKCAFCGEYLSLNLPGEVIIPLICNDQCHQGCLLASLDVNNLDYLPTCGKCHQPTRSSDDKAHSMILKQLLLQNNDNFEEKDICYHTQFIEKSTSLKEVTPPGDSYYDDLIDEILKPRVQVYSDMDTLKITKNSTHILDHVICIRSPLVYNKMDPTSSEVKLKGQLVNYLKKTVLSKIVNIEEELVNLEDLSELLMFDYIHVSTNAIDWDFMCCFLFEDTLLLIIDNSLIGEISISKDICGVNKFERVDSLTISLRNELLPELHLKSDNKLILMKWESMLIEINNRIQINIPNVIQFTTNAWGLLQGSDIELPKELRHYSTLTMDGEDIPSSYLIQALPIAQPLPINLVIAVPLFNRTTLSDEALRENITKTLHSIKDQLRPIDSLSLIFIGSYRNRNPKDKGTYIGFLDPSWKDWKLVLDDIEIIPRKDNMFNSDWDELSLTFEKCLDLFALKNESQTTINKILVLNFNDYEYETDYYDLSSLENAINELIEYVSISFIRIGKGYSDAIEKTSKVLAISKHKEQHVKLNFSCPLTRFDSFDSFIMGLDGIISNIRSICIPTIAINIEVTKEFEDVLSISEVEINGVLTAISDFKRATILVHDVFQTFERNVAFKIKLDVSGHMFHDIQFLDTNILQYNYQYLNHKSNDNYVCLNFSKSQLTPNLQESTSTVHTFSDFNDNPTIQFLNIPLLPPLSSTREPALANRQAELAVIEALNSTSGFSPKQCQELLLHSISLMYAMISLTNDNGEKNAKQLRNLFQATKGNRRYDIQNLEEEITNISRLFDDEKDTALAYTRCKDLMYFLT